MIKHAVKIKVSFDQESERILDSQSAIVNWTRNQLLDRANSLLDSFKKTQNKEDCLTLYSKRGLRNLLPELKNESPFTKSVHSSPLKNSALELSASIQAYQKSRKGKRRGRPTGWPRFSSQKKKWSSLFYDEPNKGFKVQGKTLTLSLGQTEKRKRLKVSGNLEISPLKSRSAKNETILNFRLKKEYGEFFAIFTVESEFPEPKTIKNIIALDPNHKNLAYGVGTDRSAIEIKNPWFLRKIERNIDVIKSRRDQCLRRSKLEEGRNGKMHWKPSRRWSFFQTKLDGLYRKRRDQTKTYLYTIANMLYRSYDLVSIGDYTPRGGGINKGMRRSMNNESLIGRFKDILEWVALKSGKKFHIWNEYGSTKTCSICEYSLPSSINPKIRNWECPSCNTKHIRDENAAQNGLIRTLQMLGSSRLDPVLIESRRAWRFNGLGIDSIPGAVGGISG